MLLTSRCGASCAVFSVARKLRLAVQPAVQALGSSAIRPLVFFPPEETRAAQTLWWSWTGASARPSSCSRPSSSGPIGLLAQAGRDRSRSVDLQRRSLFCSFFFFPDESFKRRLQSRSAASCMHPTPRQLFVAAILASDAAGCPGSCCGAVLPVEKNRGSRFLFFFRKSAEFFFRGEDKSNLFVRFRQKCFFFANAAFVM